jgi:hypothetical protein
VKVNVRSANRKADSPLDLPLPSFLLYNSVPTSVAESVPRICMSPTKRRYSKEEIAQRGDSIYEADVLPRLTADDQGKFVAIDVDSGMFEVDVDELAACDKLKARVPDPQIWLARVGTRYLHRWLSHSTNAMVAAKS